MVKVREDLTGWKMWEHGFENSKIIVVEQAEDYINPNGQHYAQWWCKCVCGNPELFRVTSTHLKSGSTQSCGCIRKEKSKERKKRYNSFQLNLEDNLGKFGIGYCHNTGREFYFDMDDYEKIKDYCWYEIDNYKGYRKVVTTIKKDDNSCRTTISMAQLILGNWYDHIDTNPFNNRKNNLRFCSQQDNSKNHSKYKNNKSGFIGVFFRKEMNKKIINKWNANIRINNKSKHLGYFTNKEDAIRARLQAEKEYFGEFAPQRHLFKEYGIEDDFLTNKKEG